MSDFEIGELHDIQLFSGILERPSIKKNNALILNKKNDNSKFRKNKK
jgi:hypothetical protein